MNLNLPTAALCTVLLSVFVTSSSAQQVIRTPFLELGTDPIQENITVRHNNGFTIYSVYTSWLDDTVKETIKAQKKLGFKKVDKAVTIFGIMRTLDSGYPLQAGMTYRIIAVTNTANEDLVLRALNQQGDPLTKEVFIAPENGDRVSTASFTDFVADKSETMQLRANTMNMDANRYRAITYLIFHKKS